LPHFFLGLNDSGLFANVVVGIKKVSFAGNTKA
jgi:hypothetical protein